MAPMQSYKLSKCTKMELGIQKDLPPSKVREFFIKNVPINVLYILKAVTQVTLSSLTFVTLSLNKV